MRRDQDQKMAIINFNTSNNELNVVFNNDDYVYLASMIVKLTLFVVFMGIIFGSVITFIIYKRFNQTNSGADYDSGSRSSFIAHPESDVLSDSDSEE